MTEADQNHPGDANGHKLCWAWFQSCISGSYDVRVFSCALAVKDLHSRYCTSLHQPLHGYSTYIT